LSLPSWKREAQKADRPVVRNSVFQKSLDEYPVRFIKGVGPYFADLLLQKQIETAEDLLFYYPHKYLDQRALVRITDLTPGKDRVIAGRIVTCGIAFAGRRKIFEILLGDDTGAISLKWFRFNPRQMMGIFKKGMGLLVSGEASEFRRNIQFIHPTVQIVDADVVEQVSAPGIVPVYSQIAGLGQKSLRKIVANTFGLFGNTLVDPLPESIRQKRSLISKKESLQEIHFPSSTSSSEEILSFRTPAYYREIYEEFFFMELGLALRRSLIKKEEGISIKVDVETVTVWKQGLPFTLTGAQERVFEEIVHDITEPHPMNRLLQGDVGSGKTVIAFLAALAAIEKGYQVALMAPTEILAEQHYRNAGKLLGSFKIPMALLTSRLTLDEKRRAHARIRKGLFPFVIGTHALIAEKVSFPQLGLVIIDEQHRFGVLQRAALKEKGKNPHVLVMTATPIPRTLSMTIYGDLDLSVIDELPPGRQKIETRIVSEKNRRILYNLLKERLEKGEQGYVVYPLIEESEKLALRDATRMSEELQQIFPKISIALLHGKTPTDEKESIMRSFQSGGIQLLVSTTVIEVGIDVPNATLMVIEHAERFGLSQLHQLRGRVGRGSKASLCLLVTAFGGNSPAYQRLKVMCETQDGFKIAEEDLKIRGPGDFLGTRQSGLPELRVANLIRDYSILKIAREDAFEWIQKDPKLSSYPPLKDILLRRWGQKLALADVG